MNELVYAREMIEHTEHPVQLVERHAIKVVGIKVVAPWKDLWTEVPKAWSVLRARSGEIRSRVSDVFMDVSLDETSGTYTQLVSAEVSSLEGVPDAMVALEIPAGRYLHLRHEGALDEIPGSFGRMFDWAEQEGLRADAFKLDEGYTQGGAEREHDLYVRVAS